MLLDMPKPKMS
jgi:hypothetical protein